MNVVAIAAKSIKILMRFQPLMEVEINIEKIDPNPPIVPNRKSVEPINVINPNLVSIFFPESAVAINTPNSERPSAPNIPKVAEVFSLTSGVDALY